MAEDTNSSGGGQSSMVSAQDLEEVVHRIRRTCRSLAELFQTLPAETTFPVPDRWKIVNGVCEGPIIFGPPFVVETCKVPDPPGQIPDSAFHPREMSDILDHLGDLAELLGSTFAQVSPTVEFPAPRA